MIPLTRKHLLVRGRVQGVGFRWYTREQAEARKLAGWVRNLKDGTVELEVEGEAALIEELVEAFKEYTRVDGIDEKAIPPLQAKGFEIR
jgi:acylphosphatase